jgi:hypothetical protein
MPPAKAVYERLVVACRCHGFEKTLSHAARGVFGETATDAMSRF